MNPSNVEISLTEEERQFIEILLSSTKIQGNLAQVQAWARFADEVLIAIHSDTPTICLPAETAGFLGQAVQAGPYSGDLAGLHGLQRVALPIIEKIDGSLKAALPQE